MDIIAENVEVSLGDKKILNGISIVVGAHEFVGIIGPNGSGKSTFLKCVYRVLKPASGVIRLDDTPLDRLSIRESARKVAVVSQHNYYNFEFTVRDIVLMGRAPHKKTMERDNKRDYDIVDEMLAKVGMSDYADRIFSTLSGGEQQRIILARALAQQTDCLILDEPTNHLDIKYQLQLLDVVKQLDIAVVAAFHDLNIAAMYCDRIYAVNRGEIVAQGTPEQVLTPALIRELYEVESSVVRDEFGRIQIVYHPLSNYCSRKGTER